MINNKKIKMFVGVKVKDSNIVKIYKNLSGEQFLVLNVDGKEKEINISNAIYEGKSICKDTYKGYLAPNGNLLFPMLIPDSISNYIIELDENDEIKDKGIKITNGEILLKNNLDINNFLTAYKNNRLKANIPAIIWGMIGVISFFITFCITAKENLHLRDEISIIILLLVALLILFCFATVISEKMIKYERIDIEEFKTYFIDIL